MLRPPPAAASERHVPLLPLSRRTGLVALAAALGVVSVSCTAPDQVAPDRSKGAADPVDRSAADAPEADPDVELAAAMRAQEQELVDRIDATVTAYPGLRGVLADTRAGHVAHVALLAEALPVTDPENLSPSESPTVTTPYRVAGSRAAALTALARREARLSLAGKQSAFAAESGAFARVLASMAAAASQQASRLRDLDGGRR